jgi:phasin
MLLDRRQLQEPIMFDKPSMEIPAAVREIAERNVEQTRSAYGQFLTLAHQAQDLMMKSQGEAMRSALEVQSKAMRYAEQNVDASFRFASDLAQARDMKEYAEIQTRYAQTQVATFNQQAQDLGRLVVEVAQKVKPKV